MSFYFILNSRPTEYTDRFFFFYVLEVERISFEKFYWHFRPSITWLLCKWWVVWDSFMRLYSGWKSSVFISIKGSFPIMKLLCLWEIIRMILWDYYLSSYVPPCRSSPSNPVSFRLNVFRTWRSRTYLWDFIFIQIVKSKTFPLCHASFEFGIRTETKLVIGRMERF